MQEPSLSLDTDPLRKRQLMAQLLMGQGSMMGGNMGPIGGSIAGALSGYLGGKMVGNTPYKG